MSNVYKIPKISRGIKPKPPAPLKSRSGDINNNNTNNNNIDNICSSINTNNINNKVNDGNINKSNNNNNYKDCYETECRPVLNIVSVKSRKADTKNGNIAARSFGSFLRNLRHENPLPKKPVCDINVWLENNPPKRKEWPSDIGSNTSSMEYNARFKPASQVNYDENRNGVFEEDRNRSQISDIRSTFSSSKNTGTDWDLYLISFVEGNNTDSKITDPNNNVPCINFNVPEKSIQATREECNNNEEYNIYRDENKKVLSAYENHRHLQPSSSQHDIQDIQCLKDTIVIPQAIDNCDTVYPEDLDLIEAELSFMRDNSGECEEEICPFDREHLNNLIEDSKDTLCPYDNRVSDKGGNFNNLTESKDGLSTLDDTDFTFTKYTNTKAECRNSKKALTSSNEKQAYIDNSILTVEKKIVFDKKDNSLEPKEKLCPLEYQINVKTEDLGSSNLLQTSTEVKNEPSKRGIYGDYRKCHRDGYVVLIRNPISPVTVPEDIYCIESTMPGGHYTAKTRRRMFRNYKMYRQEEAASTTATILQYSAEELLKIGCSPICHEAPECWAYILEMLPMICSPVSQHFDSLHYLEERSYVEEQIGYIWEPNVGNMKKNIQKHRTTESSNFNQHSNPGAKPRWMPSETLIARDRGTTESSNFNQHSNPGAKPRWTPSEALIARDGGTTESSNFNQHSNPDAKPRWTPSETLIARDRGTTESSNFNQHSNPGAKPRWTLSEALIARDRGRQIGSNQLNLDCKSDVSVRQGTVRSYKPGSSSRLNNNSNYVDQRLKLWPIKYQGSFDNREREKCPW